MGNLKRQFSSEDAQKVDQEAAKYSQTKVEMDDKTGRPETVLEMDNLIDSETDITLTKEEIKDLILKGQKNRRKICSLKNFYLALLGVVLAGLVVWNVVDKYLENTDRIERKDGTPHWQNEHEPTAQFSKQIHGKGTATEPIRPEEYEIDADILYENRVVLWKGQKGNKQVISETSAKDGCISIKTTGTLKVFNAVTFDFSNTRSLFHTITKCRAERCDVVRKASFSWPQPQSGRRPSILQFLVQVETGDELCLQTSSSSLIYAGVQDNVLLIEKIPEA